MDKNKRIGIIQNLVPQLIVILCLSCLAGCATTMVLSEIKHPPQKTDWLYDIQRAFSDGERIVIIFRAALASAHPVSQNTYSQYWLVFSKHQLLKSGFFDYIKEYGYEMIVCHNQLDRTHIHKRIPQNMLAGMEEIKVIRTAEEWKTFYSQRSFQNFLLPASRFAVLTSSGKGAGTGLVFKIIEMPCQELRPTCYRITVDGKKDTISVFRSFVLLPFAMVVDIVATPLQLIFGKT